MNIDIIEFGDKSARWDLVQSFFEFRRKIFIERMGWDLVPHYKIEFDQYDAFPTATYIIAHQDEKILGGARLLRCDTEIGSGKVVYSYMIRDAWRGIIDLPDTICWHEPPKDVSSWELTRLLTVRPSPAIVRAILDRANRYLWERSAKNCLFLGPKSFMRMAKIFGYQPEALGDVCGNKDGKFLAFRCAVQATRCEDPKITFALET